MWGQDGDQIDTTQWDNSYMNLDQPRRLLAIIEDDAGILDFLSQVIGDLGFDALLFSNPLHFLAYLDDQDQRRPTAILSDIAMPKMNGLELLLELRKKGDSTPVVYLTGSQHLDYVVQAVRLGASDFIFKPANVEEIEMVVSRVLELGRQKRDIEDFRAALKQKYPIMREDLEYLESLESKRAKFQALNVTRRAS